MLENPVKIRDRKASVFLLPKFKLSSYHVQGTCFKRLLRPFSIKVISKVSTKLIKQISYRGKVMKKQESWFSKVFQKF